MPPGNAAESRQDARTGRAGSDTGGGPDTARGEPGRPWPGDASYAAGNDTGYRESESTQTRRTHLVSERFSGAHNLCGDDQ